MSKKTKIILIILGVLLLIQLFPVTKNISNSDQPQNITKMYDIPAEVQSVLEVACYDCHSNNTHYPWYNKIQPVAWWLQNHVKDGKKHLNFDEFGSYTPKKQAHKLEELSEMVEEGEMPLASYTLIHRNAVLTSAQKTMLVNWANNLKLKINETAVSNINSTP